MLAASEPIAGGDGALDIVLGAGAILLFVGLVVRAVAVRRPNRLLRRRVAATLRTLGSRLPLPGAAPHANATTRSPAFDPQRRWSPGPRSTPRSAVAVDPAPGGAEREHTDPLAGMENPAPTSSSSFAEAPEPELTRLDARTLAPLARTLERSRRLRAAEDRVAGELAVLQDGLWLVERYVLIGTRRIPFLVAGATGMFVICATDGGWTIDDVHLTSRSAHDVRALLRNADARVEPAVCMAFDNMAPRTWFGGESHHGAGGWLLGIDWLQRWMFSFGPQHGLRNGDVRRLTEAAGPRWERRPTARLPTSRNFG